MNLTALALTGYIIWFMVLLGVIAAVRTGLTLSGKRDANSFKPDGYDVSEFSGRLCRAHANCYESFPFIGGLLVLALVGNLTHLTESLALVLLAARIGQSVVHLLSTAVIAVQVRFTLFLIQYLIGLYWAILFLVYYVS